MTKRPKYTNNDYWNAYRNFAKLMIKTIKPWKISSYGDTEDGQGLRYIAGWNACLKEIKKKEDAWFDKMDKKYNAYL